MAEPFFILDTNILMALIRGKRLGRYIDETYKLREQVQRPLISYVTQGEILSLAEQNNWGAPRREALSVMLNNLVIVDVNHPDILQGYVDLDMASYNHHPTSITMGKNDLWIAATTKATGSTLLTTDKDFDHLQPAHIKSDYIDPASRLPGDNDP